ncbi:permease prefix domain 1-containing protein [Bacillus anthracis]|uniref:HAAS signaling domain-containing protein n=1 Tax=Bacillus cereus group TaxID=86661 RepID=UPI001F59E127|nr:MULTISPECIES: permease prefix domain 1-containing protein [Bacillus cereus group]MEB9505265.1 permease prefix domain 1-containing protein [Bacillus anthracis]
MNSSKVHFLNVQDFLVQLDKELLSFSKKERENILAEIEAHLYSLIKEKQAEGKTEEKAVEEAINSFVSPKKLASDLKKTKGSLTEKIVDEEKEEWFNFIAIFLGTGIFDLSIFLFNRDKDYVLITGCLILILLFNIWLFKTDNWNLKTLNFIKWGYKTLCFLGFPLTIFAFFFGKDFSSFWIMYFVIYIILIFIQFFIFRYIIKQKSLELE